MDASLDHESLESFLLNRNVSIPHQFHSFDLDPLQKKSSHKLTESLSSEVLAELVFEQRNTPIVQYQRLPIREGVTSEKRATRREGVGIQLV